MLSAYEPSEVLAVFEEYCRIPHGSGNVSAAADFCVKYARDRGFSAEKDRADNVVIRVPGTPGKEQAAPVILQGHLDMVCEKEADCDLDFEKDPLRLRVANGWLFAEGTTLGGDDGIAVAMMLALLSSDAPHPPLELVFTSDEEVGMLGADAMDMSRLTGRRMLNLDSETEGVLTVACAGGERITLDLPVTRAPADGGALRIRLSGLRGGHSGEEINSGRENADVLLVQLLSGLYAEHPFRLCALAGGSKDNAIPREAEAVLVCGDPDRFRAAAQDAFCRLAARFPAEAGMAFEASPCAHGPALDRDGTERVLKLITACPNGVQTMREEAPDQVQTSLNLGILELSDGALRAVYLVRSCVNEERDALSAALRKNAETLGGSASGSGRYPAWEYVSDSPLRRLLVEIWTEQNGRAPEVISIHAGLECGLFSGRLPGLDCVSFGPDLQDIHTPRERMDLASAARCWKYLLAVLERL